MIGYYVHHQGRGHLHRALALQAQWRGTVCGLSTCPRPLGWRGPWVRLPRDDMASCPVDPTANDQLHWAPLRDPGVRRRAAAISAWLDQQCPEAVVVDVSVEVALLLRLHGVPVVTMVLPGRRHDPVHLSGFRASSALVAAWPATTGLDADFVPGLPDDVRGRIVCLGGVSRFPVAGTGRTPGRGRYALLIQGHGGGSMWSGTVSSLERRTPGWRWTVLGGPGGWTDDPSEAIRCADVVVTSAGQGSLADVAALRRPAVVVAADRPYGEQHATAEVLRRGPWPAVVATGIEEAVAPSTLEHAAGLDAELWSSWCDGSAGTKLRGVLDEVVAR